MPQAGYPRNRFNLNRPPFNSPTPVYPTQSLPTTPVTLQQPSGSLSLALFSTDSGRCCRATFFPCRNARASLARGQLRHGPHSDAPSDLPWLSTRDVTTRRAHSPLPFSKCLHMTMIPPLLYLFGSYHNVESCDLTCIEVHVESSDERLFPLLRIDGTGS